MGLFAPLKEVDNLLGATFMAIRVCRVGILLCPSAIAIEGYADMARSLGEIEIAINPPLIKRVEQRLDRFTNTGEQSFAPPQMMRMGLCRQ